MKLRGSDLWLLRGTIGPFPFLAWALVLSTVKFGIDLAIATAFGQTWSLRSYVYLALFNRTGWDESRSALFLLSLGVASIPFLWMGLALTLKRLRDAGLPTWLVALFVLPAIKFLLFVALCVTPSHGTRARRSFASRWNLVPASACLSAVAGILVAVAIAVLGIWVSTLMLRSYSWSLFMGLPFCAGFFAAYVHSLREQRTLGQCLLVSFYAILLAGCALLVFALEGIICILMAAPLALVPALLGGLVAYAIQRASHESRQTSAGTGALLLALPILMHIEARAPRAPDVYEVRTSVDIRAPVAHVWHNVVAFPDIEAEPEWIFRHGISCPMRARIDGRGVGAIRYCEFTTGAFVEPITEWDEPRRLAFDVTENPLPMREWSPYGEIHPPHLDGFMQSKKGRFDLASLPDGGTRLVGTTWYSHGLWPSEYWRWWSDAIIHRIHLRVLRHIKAEAEQDVTRDL